MTETEILGCIQAGANLQALKRQLRCGTECGSCVPELKRMLLAEVSSDAHGSARERAA